MYRSYLLGMLVVTAIAAAVAGLLNETRLDTVPVQAVQIPEPVSTTAGPDAQSR